jgi:RHS repeat-associated protein
MVLTPEGYLTKSNNKYFYNFYLRDHLGNNREVIKWSGAMPYAGNWNVVQENEYYPFGMPYPTAGYYPEAQPYKFGGKEMDEMNGLKWYDSEARQKGTVLPPFTTRDPLAEKYYNISPYAYCLNNPVRFTDPTGKVAGDFLDENGRIIGNDGNADGRVYVMNTNASSDSKQYIRTNSGNTEAFSENKVAYENSTEIEGSPTARQEMVTEVSRDNGKGGTREANNREYGGSVSNGVVTTAEPGAVANPKTDATASIDLSSGVSTFHSHPSGTITETSYPSAGTVFGSTTTTTYSFNQPPSSQDISNAGSTTNYVFGRSSGTVYIYTSSGTQATIPTRYFVTPRH